MARITLDLYCKSVKIVSNPIKMRHIVIKAVSNVDTALLHVVEMSLPGALHNEKSDLQASSVQSF